MSENFFETLPPEAQAEYIQQIMKTILSDPAPSLLSIVVLPVLATDSRNGFDNETRHQLMDMLLEHKDSLVNIMQNQMNRSRNETTTCRI